MKKPHCGVQLSPQLLDCCAISIPKTQVAERKLCEKAKWNIFLPKTNISPLTKHKATPKAQGFRGCGVL